MDYIDLRDLEGQEKKTWKKAIEDQTGCDFDEMAENEPTMIPDCEFREYAQNLAEDVGAINKDNNWPVYCIDWDRATDELKMDYSSVEVGGIEYWFRAW